MANTTVTKDEEQKEAAKLAEKERKDREATMTSEQKAAAKADNEAAEARTKAQLLQEEADRAKDGRTPEQKKADDAKRDADDAAAKAAEANSAARIKRPMTMEEAKVQGYGMNEDMPAGHHMAQKFGNDPANPAPAPGLSPNPGVPVVRLSRKTPDNPDLVYTECHPDMVGDYMRAGWNKADDLPPIREVPGKDTPATRREKDRE